MEETRNTDLNGRSHMLNLDVDVRTITDGSSRKQM
jgi:hypothetical protein